MASFLLCYSGLWISLSAIFVLISALSDWSKHFNPGLMLTATLDPVQEAGNSQAEEPEKQVDDEQAAMDLSLFAQLASHATPLPPRLSLSSTPSPNHTSYARRQSTSAIDSVVSRRHVHNVCERKRRDHIRNGFQLLHDRLPAKDERLSKMEILRSALEHVKWLKREVERLESSK